MADAQRRPAQVVDRMEHSGDDQPEIVWGTTPDDRCQCPHWGFVIKGKVTYHYGDGSETIVAGEAYFIPPGHTPELHAGTELVEFSPTAELERTLEVVLRNVKAAQAES